MSEIPTQRAWIELPHFVDKAMRFRIHLTPRGAARTRAVINPKTKRLSMAQEEKYEAWHAAACTHFKVLAANHPEFKAMIWEAPVWVGIHFLFPKPNSLRSESPWAVTCKTDIDNAEKAVYDALNGIFLADDHRIVANANIKHWTTGKPGFEITIGTIKDNAP